VTLCAYCHDKIEENDARHTLVRKAVPYAVLHVECWLAAKAAAQP
jgi:hypothetical protein